MMKMAKEKLEDYFPLPIGNAGDLAAWLKKEDIRPKDLKVGDIVLGPVENVYRVGRIEKKDDGYYVYDEFNNGGGPHTPDSWFRIIPRKFIAKEPYV